MLVNEAAKTQSARELYDPRYLHWPGCGRLRTLADVLKMTCPHCGAATLQGLAPEVTPWQAARMLGELQAKRAAIEQGKP